MEDYEEDDFFEKSYYDYEYKDEEVRDFYRSMDEDFPGWSGGL
ncbi:MAG: hypothetical protein ACI3ZY_13955 [Parabacteroides sp.]